MKQYYIEAAQSMGGALFFCSSVTQGERMVPFAYSMAVRFESKGKAIAKKKKLAEKYKGLKLTIRIAKVN